MNELDTAVGGRSRRAEATVDGTTYRLGDTVTLRLVGRSDPYDRILDGRSATIERIFLDYDDKLYFGVTVDDDPGQQLMRETGPVPLLLRRRARTTGGVMSGAQRADPDRGRRQHVDARRRLRRPRSCASSSSASSEPGVTIEDFGTGGLDLAYEVMRGYDSLVLIDVMRGDGPPGTLYVLEPEESEIAAGIEDGEMIDPHAMDPQTVLRFVRAVSGWPGSVVVIACEPRRGRGLRAWASRPRSPPPCRAPSSSSLETLADLREKAQRASAL